MMVELYVRAQNGFWRLGRRIREEQQGLTMIEYGVAAAFLVLLMAGAALTVGPELRDWLVETVCDIINSSGCGTSAT